MKQNVIVTIDTEGHDGKDPISKLILGNTSQGSYGIEYIMNVLDEFDVKAIFFVDFAEAWDYGEEKIENVVNTILRRGHDVGVHIHPDHMADKNRLFLWQYSREEQYDIIKKCTELYIRLVGTHPLSFRAGKYSANLDTLDIINELGYQYDFSCFYHQQWCGVDPSFTVNTPCKYKDLVEFPVTMHTAFSLSRIKREDKIDIEGMTSSELQYALKQIIKQDFPVVVTLFFHSFSLLKWRDNPDMPAKNKYNIKKLRTAISNVKKNNMLDFISEKDLCGIIPVEKEQALKSQIVWESNIKGFVYTYFKALRIAKYNRKAKLLVTGSGAFGILLLLVIMNHLTS